MSGRGRGSLRAYLLTRLALTLPLLLLLLTATFLLLRVAPGDPVTATLGERVSDTRAAQLRASLGLDDPLWKQYGRYLADVAQGDFGRAITTKRPVRETISQQFPATLELTLAAMVVAVGVGLVIGGVFVRLVRVNMLQTLRADFVEAARARGIPERDVVFGHALKNALVPVVAVVGLQFALLLSGAVLTETTFTWPGLGKSLYDFLGDRDYTAVQGLVTFFACFVVAVSLLIDVVSAWIDPRIRYS